MSFTDTGSLRRYAESHRLRFPVLSDPDRTTYRRYGFERGAFARVWGVRAWARYVGLLRRRRSAMLRRVGRPIEDTLQLGGDVVIGPDGRLSWGHWGAGPDDRPSVDTLIEAVRTARADHPRGDASTSSE